MPELGHPARPPVSPPGAGDMNQPTWSTDVFIPDKNGTTVSTSGIRTNAVPAGIYTVWLEGHSGNPYFQTRRYPVPVKVGGATRDFSLANSTTSATIAAMGGTAAIPIYVSTTNASSTKWGTGRQRGDAGRGRGLVHRLLAGPRHHRRRPADVLDVQRHAHLIRQRGALDPDHQQRRSGARLLSLQRPRLRHQWRRPAGRPHPAGHLHGGHLGQLGQLRRHHRLRRLPDHRHQLQRHLRPCRERHLSRSNRPNLRRAQRARLQPW